MLTLIILVIQGIRHQIMELFLAIRFRPLRLYCLLSIQYKNNSNTMRICHFFLDSYFSIKNTLVDV